MECHNHRLQTNPRDHEEETQNANSHNTIKVKQPNSLFQETVVQQERTTMPKPQNKEDPMENTYTNLLFRKEINCNTQTISI